MTTFNIAVWGLGNHAIKRILPEIAKLQSLNLIGVCSRNIIKVNQCAKKWKCLGWVNPQEMLINDEVDIIYIASPIGIHFPFAEQALNSGKHVWCEKPLTCNYKDTKFLLNLAEKNKIVVLESFMYLYHPQFCKVKKFVNEGKNIHSIICRFGIPNLEEPGFRSDPNLCGGAFWDVASYPISALFEIYHEQEVKVLFSEISYKNDSPIDTDGRALLSFSGGANAYIEWGVGIAYKNEIDIWSEDESFFTDKIFSKPADFIPTYYFRDCYGNEKIKKGQMCEQFSEMLTKFTKILSNDEEIKLERRMILGRAKLMDNILNLA